MADQNPSIQSLLHSLDPISLILSQYSLNSKEPLTLKLATDYAMERGPRYRAYAELRESKLRKKCFSEEPEIKQTPQKKQVKFQENVSNSRKGYSDLAQSVPDFSATLRKENRKPRQELTPPSKISNGWSKVHSGILSNSRGSKSASAGEKRAGLMVRKSYANVEELKGLSMAAAAAINGGDNRGGIRGGRRTVLGSRQF
ncbi:uncharacterized protein LOC126677190 [Mercurialis annua]|uniref:uncharacterized protein LOC126677190 n=1 Tax=Mercurialis annua TaxID=3986 RepID=UPI002160DEB5|nr:uncharacterized protein LOC126677190 [Mercurialis annua]